MTVEAIDSKGRELLPVVVVAGATASGKTAFAIRLAHLLDGEIVSCDSMQVYRRMDIGTAKPDAAEQAAAPHHLINMVEPDQTYTASSYRTDAAEAIREITARGRAVILAGGTGLYLRALVHGLSPAPARDDALREELTREGERVGWEALHSRLLQVDPHTAEKVSPKDKSRIIRGLEVYQLTGGVPLSVINREHGFSGRHYRTLIFGMQVDRPVLQARIRARLEEMMTKGFMDEVEGLLAHGYSPQLKSMQSLGYRELCQVLDGRMELAEAKESIFTNTCRYAKRQETWFKAMGDVQWVAPGEPGVLEECARQADQFLGESKGEGNSPQA